MNQNLAKTLSMLFIMAVVFLVFRYSSAAFFLNKAEDLYKKGINQTGKERTTALLNALEKVDHALTLRPENAEAIDLKAEIIYRQWWNEPDGKYLDDSALLQQSKALHVKALSIRKEWAFTISQLARIEAHKPKLDDAFFERFHQTYELGRYESAIALDMMRISTTRWPELDADSKDKAIEFIYISIEQKRNNLKLLAKILNDNGLLEFICSQEKTSERKKIMCNL